MLDARGLPDAVSLVAPVRIPDMLPTDMHGKVKMSERIYGRFTDSPV